MKRRPTVIRLAPDAAEVIRARRAKAAMLNRVSAALAPILAETAKRELRMLGDVVISFGSGIYTSATDAAGAQSALGAAAGRAEPFCPPRAADGLASRHFARRRA